MNVSLTSTFLASAAGTSFGLGLLYLDNFLISLPYAVSSVIFGTSFFLNWVTKDNAEMEKEDDSVQTDVQNKGLALSVQVDEPVDENETGNKPFPGDALSP